MASPDCPVPPERPLPDEHPGPGCRSTQHGVCAERCNRNDGASCYALGHELERAARAGPELERAARAGPELERAAKTYERGCSAGDPHACYAGGLLYLGWTGIGRRIALAVPLLRTACGAGHRLACFRLASELARGESYRSPQRFATILLEADPACSLRLYEYACANHHMPSCSGLGLFLQNESAFLDPERAAKLLQRACEAKDYLGCTYLAGAYESGLGVPKDEVRSVDLLRTACDHGESSGCLNLGSAYEEGNGVPMNFAQAATLYRQACDNDNSSACGFLAPLVEEGMGTPKDRAEAVRLYRQACRGGMPYGCLELERLGEPRLSRTMSSISLHRVHSGIPCVSIERSVAVHGVRR